MTIHGYLSEKKVSELSLAPTHVEPKLSHLFITIYKISSQIFIKTEFK
jgi:hypothetical protein